MTKRKLFIVGTVLATVICAAPAGGQAEKPGKPPGPNFEGVWKLVSIRTTLRNEETELPIDGPLIERFMVVRGNNVICFAFPDHGIWRFKTESSKRPKELDLLDVVEMYDNAKGKSALKCIYELEKDTLKVRFHFGVARATYMSFLSPEAPRPSGFKGGECPDVTLTFQRLPK